MLAALDNLRVGRQEVPAASFRYASRGVWLFLAGLIYGLVMAVVFYGGFFAITFGLTPPAPERRSSQVALLFFPLMLGWMGFF